MCGKPKTYLHHKKISEKEKILADYDGFWKH